MLFVILLIIATGINSWLIKRHVKKLRAEVAALEARLFPPLVVAEAASHAPLTEGDPHA